MTNRINKISTIFSFLLLSLFLSSCSEGDRGFVPIAEEQVEELEPEVFITGGAVKGPLINAEINVYKFELDKGPIFDFNNAINAWLSLLNTNQVSVTGDSFVLGNVDTNTVKDNLQQKILEFGYVTELKFLKSNIKNALTFSDANTLIQAYIDETETNSEVIKEVLTILNSSATLSELKTSIMSLETLTDKLLKVDTFSSAKNLLSLYRSYEPVKNKQDEDNKKIQGFTDILAQVDMLSVEAAKFNLPKIRDFYQFNIFDTFLNDFTLQNDPVARQNLINLKTELFASVSITDAELAIEKTHRKEGNQQIRSLLSQLLNKIITIQDVKQLVLGNEALYHDFSIRPYIVEGASFDEIYQNVSNSFKNSLDASFRDSLIILDDAGEPTNRLSYGVSNSQGVLPGLKIGDYRGFVYMEANALNRTIDLNSGKRPIFEQLQTIFHTDEILGNGDNALENKTVYLLLNGEVQKDSNGDLITDSSLIDKTNSDDKLLTVRPSYFATPLTNLAFGLSLEKLKAIDFLNEDYDLDLLPDNKISESALKHALGVSSNIVEESIGIGLADNNIFKSVPVRLSQMQYSLEEELAAIQYRLSIENFSSFIYELMKLTDLNSANIFNLIIKDLSDGQIDGRIHSTLITEFSNIEQYEYLFRKDPTENIIPDTNFLVSNILYLMNAEFPNTLSEESLNTFQAKLADIQITSPIGGTDLDSDGVLDNEDQYPSDPTKSRDLSAGYAGIWSVNYDSSATEYMPFNKPFDFKLDVEQIEGECINEPCVGLGDASILVMDEYKLISAPQNNDFELAEPNDDSIIGFSAFASTPGDYLVKAVLSTPASITPTQTYTVFVPIHVIDPKSIEIKFSPNEPQPGEKVEALFKATKALCSLYQVCSKININDNEDDFLPLSLLSDVFSIKQKVLRDGNVLSYSDVSSMSANQQISNLSNIELNDSVTVTVSFNAGNRSIVASTYNKIVGDILDSDSDGSPDTSDLFPHDGACFLEKDGLLDTNNDGEFNSLDLPKCFESFQSDSIISFDVSFLNETWFYYPSNPEWDFIIRKNKYTAGYNGYIKVPTIQGTKEKITLFEEDPISKRIYFAYENGAIDYYSLENQSLSEFLPPYAFNPVTSMNILGTYLLVDYAIGDSNEVKLFNKNSNEAIISSDNVYPKPGTAISLNIDNQNLISATNNLLSIEWLIEREDQNQAVQTMPALITNDDLTLNSGQTVFGDVVKLIFSYTNSSNNVFSFEKEIFVLGIDSVAFGEKTFYENEPILLNLEGFNSSQLENENKSLFVKWYKNDINSTEYVFSLSDKTYPFTYEASNFEFGDLIRADLYIKHGTKDLPITSAEAVILGDLNTYQPKIDVDSTFIDLESRTFKFVLIEPENNDYFNLDSFKPIWKINNEIVSNENSLYFPSLSTTNIKYGDSISVSYNYHINGIKGETSTVLVLGVQPDFQSSTFTISPAVAQLGQDIQLNSNSFTDLELLKITPKWRVNGVLDTDVESFIYPSEKLKYGDSVELFLLRKGSDEIANAYSHIATATVGLNLSSLESQTPDPSTDIDSDNDGTPNFKDYFRYDKNCSLPTEGIPDDIDLDGISDLDELTATIKTNPNLKDSDKDGLSDVEELSLYFTDPSNPDSDGDGYLDGVEIDISNDIADANNALKPGNSLVDNDFDGLSNELELINKTKVNKFDTDNDGLSDWYEISKSGTDPLNPDTDGDKLSDGAEIRKTGTNPNLADTDEDTLPDGLEVALKLDPTKKDSNSNGIDDNLETGFDFNFVINSVLYESDLINYENNFSTFLSIKQGTCFKTWLANEKPTLISNSHTLQVDTNSQQELAFASEAWNQIIRYDAKSNLFTSLIDVSDYNSIVTSMDYDINDPTILYIGFADGLIRQFKTQTNTFTDLFNTGIELAISSIVNQGEILITEQIDSEGLIHHSAFDLNALNTVPPPTTVLEPTSTTISDYSYKNSIWLDTSRKELLSFDETFSRTSFIKETVNSGLSNPIESIELIDTLQNAASPLFIDNLSGQQVLRFGNGLAYNLSNNSVLNNLVSPFESGLEHQTHRVLSLKNSSFLQVTTKSNLSEDQNWRFTTQLNNENVLKIVPVGYHLLAISFDKPTSSVAKDGKISFQKIILGDENSDTLPDWWNNLSSTLTVSDYNDFLLTQDALIPDLLDGTPNIDDSIVPPVLVDTDNDNICDNWEIALFNTDPFSADTDNDGMSDSQELSILISAADDCSIYPSFTVISDPLNPDSDGDGLLDGEEKFTYFTELLSPDTDNDGLTDYQEVKLTNTDPLNAYSIANDKLDGEQDSDQDGLSDSDELNKYNTNPNEKSSDSDNYSDKEEIDLGTNPNNSDSDGDGINDYDEGESSGDKKSDPSAYDSDQDGLSDSLELALGSMPMNVDSDGDGISDFDEYETYEYVYSDELLTILIAQNNQIVPKTKTAFTKSDLVTNTGLNANADTDNDGICDKWEILEFKSNPAEADTDGDGLTDSQELGIDTPLDCINKPSIFILSNFDERDTDLDGVIDGDELNILGTDPKDNDSDDDNINDGDEDFDGDGLTNYQELELTDTNPLNPDSNGNGINDNKEDSDGDGLFNWEEVNLYGTDPLNPDTDGDGISDKKEIDANLNPQLSDTDGDGLSDYDEINNEYDSDPAIQDTDGDGLSDYEEFALKTRPRDPDTDNDFLLDGEDPNPLDIDFDSDGIPDGIEVRYLLTDPASRDTDDDGLNDGYEAWVFAYCINEADQSISNELLKIGVESNNVETQDRCNPILSKGVKLNSKLGISDWDSPEKFTENGTDRVIYDLVDVLDSSIVIGKLYIQRYSNPTKEDSDDDGLRDATEFEIERVYGVAYDEPLSPGAFKPLNSNFENFKISNPWNKFSKKAADTDTDGDGLSDIYETKYTLTDPKKADTDNDGIADGLENEDSDLLNNLQEILYGSNPHVFDINLDSDGDGLLDYFEIYLLDNYDINLKDSNSNGISDDLEDVDQDLLTNIEELKFKTDPLVKDFGLDTDGDGLSNYQELFITLTNPLMADSDNNGTLDGLEDFDNDLINNLTELLLGSDPFSFDDVNNIPDTDNDGLTDFQEINLTSTNPLEFDTDSNGISDAFEDSDSDGLSNFQEVKLGMNPLVNDADQLQKHSDNDGLVDIYEIKITNTDPLLDDTDSDGVLDGQDDFDNDGLSYFNELLMGTNPLLKDQAIDTDGDSLTDAQEILLTLTDPAIFDTDSNSISDGNEDFDGDGITNIQEVANLSDPRPLSDDQKDSDNDLYINVLDQNNESTSVTKQDSDGDLLFDGIEILLGTDPSKTDTDDDGLSDNSEIKSITYKEVAINALCSDTELRLSSIAGKDYCFTIEYVSYPTLNDSDNDGVADRSIDENNVVIIDHFPLDASCFLASDGFENLDLGHKQCFSSWMSGFDAIENIKSVEWLSSTNQDHAELIFFNSTWNLIVRYNILTESFLPPISIDTNETVLAIDLVSLTRSLYIFYANGKLERVDLETGTIQTVDTFAHAGLSPSTLLTLDSGEVILQFVDANNQSSLYLYDQTGVQLDLLSGLQVDLDGALFRCTNANCDIVGNIYSFVVDSNGLIINLASIEVDLQTKRFGSIEYANTLAQFSELKGPIRLSEADDKVYLGSGQILELDLQGSDHSQNLSITHFGKTYSEFYDLAELNGHFIGVIDYSLSGIPGAPNEPAIQNGLIARDLVRDQNKYLLPPLTLEEKILGLFPYEGTSLLETTVVSRLQDRILIENLGVSDKDGDGMPGIYEKFYGLNDDDRSDKFDDPDLDGLVNIEEYILGTDPLSDKYGDQDNDGLTNVEEYRYGTNPLNKDTDGDGFNDYSEIFNNTNPLDPLDF